MYDSEDLARLCLAVALGALVGAEREFRDRPAGFRTNICICLGAALFTMISVKMAGGKTDPARIAAQIVSGVGFLGAGAIMRDGGSVTGLTTAATIWLVAALGMAVGAGNYGPALMGTALTMGVLWLFYLIEHRIDRVRDTRTYEIILARDCPKAATLQTAFADCKLKLESAKRTRRGDQLICQFRAKGAPDRHDALIERFIADADVQEVKF